MLLLGNYFPQKDAISAGILCTCSCYLCLLLNSDLTKMHKPLLLLQKVYCFTGCYSATCYIFSVCGGFMVV